MPPPRGWLGWVNAAQGSAEEETLRRCGRRGKPFGLDSRVQEAVRRLGLETTLRPRGADAGAPLPAVKIGAFTGGR